LHLTIFDAQKKKEEKRERKRSCGTKKKGKLPVVYLFSNTSLIQKMWEKGKKKKNMTQKVNRLWSRKKCFAWMHNYSMYNHIVFRFVCIGHV